MKDQIVIDGEVYIKKSSLYGGCEEIEVEAVSAQYFRGSAKLKLTLRGEGPLGMVKTKFAPGEFILIRKTMR